MAAKTAYIRARIEPKLKNDVESIFEEYGVTPTQVLNMLYKQVKRTHKLPFDMFSKPNKETLKAITEAKRGIGVKSYKNSEELFKDLGI